MNRPKDCVVAVYGEIDDAQSAIQKLDRSGLPARLTSLVSTDLCPTEAAAGGAGQCYQDHPAECPPTCNGNAACEWSGACVPKILQFGDDMEKDAAIGAGAGGIVGLIAGAGVLFLMLFLSGCAATLQDEAPDPPQGRLLALEADFNTAFVAMAAYEGLPRCDTGFELCIGGG